MQDSYYPPFATVCGQCGVVEPKYLHHVRHCATFRRLCTTCVLRLHPQCFCPTCLEVYDGSPPIDAVVCCKCYSSSHPACLSPEFSGTVTSTMTLSRCSSVCASCVNPNLLVLNLNRVESSDGGRVVDRIDLNAARLLLAAGKIAAMSMIKAEVVAANESVKRAEEAANARKSAGEALDHLARLMVKEKSDKKVGNVGAGVGVVDVSHMDNVDGKGDVSGKVLEPLNAVELEVGKEVVKVVDVVGGKNLGGDSVCGNGCVKDDMLVKVVENGQEHCCGDVVVV
ncbi:putative chromatin regulator PHD family [Helianthus annuus]|nr:putative chromatin regulator PHD family [Helianthus annuus]